MKALKCEQVYLSEYDSLSDAKAQIDHFLEAVYNQKRLHSSLGYLPTVEYEETFEQTYNADLQRRPTTRTETRTRPSHLTITP